MMPNCFAFFRDFGDAIGPAFVSGRCYRNFRAPSESGLGDAHVVGGDDDRVERLGAEAAFPNMLKQRFARR